MKLRRSNSAMNVNHAYFDEQIDNPKFHAASDAMLAIPDDRWIFEEGRSVDGNLRGGKRCPDDRYVYIAPSKY